jgi:hypothetical protein
MVPTRSHCDGFLLKNLTVCCLSDSVGFALASFSRTIRKKKRRANSQQDSTTSVVVVSTLSHHLSFSFAHPFSFLFTCHQHNIVTHHIMTTEDCDESTGDEDSGGKDQVSHLLNRRRVMLSTLRNLKIILRKSSSNPPEVHCQFRHLASTIFFLDDTTLNY